MKYAMLLALLAGCSLQAGKVQTLVEQFDSSSDEGDSAIDNKKTKPAPGKIKASVKNKFESSDDEEILASKKQNDAKLLKLLADKYADDVTERIQAINQAFTDYFYEPKRIFNEDSGKLKKMRDAAEDALGKFENKFKTMKVVDLEKLNDDSTKARAIERAFINTLRNKYDK